MTKIPKGTAPKYSGVMRWNDPATGKEIVAQTTLWEIPVEKTEETQGATA